MREHPSPATPPSSEGARPPVCRAARPAGTTRPLTRRAMLAAAPALTLGAALLGAERPAPAGGPVPFATLRWGVDVSRRLGDESDSEGPKSFALGPEGEIWVLDQVARRAVVLDATARVADVVPLERDTYDDLEHHGGRLLLLDRLARRSLSVLDRQGKLLRELALEGSFVPHAGLVTALLTRRDGVWLEVEHRRSVKVLGPELSPCERKMVVGRPISSARSLQASLDGRGGVELALGPQSEGTLAPSARVVTQAPARRIVWLDEDRRGRLHLVAHEIEREPARPFAVRREALCMLELDDSLVERSRRASPFVLSDHDQRAEVRVSPDGALWQMALGPTGVSIYHWARSEA